MLSAAAARRSSETRLLGGSPGTVTDVLALMCAVSEMDDIFMGAEGARGEGRGNQRFAFVLISRRGHVFAALFCRVQAAAAITNGLLSSCRHSVIII